jgi:hypothetical protein
MTIALSLERSNFPQGEDLRAIYRVPTSLVNCFLPRGVVFGGLFLLPTGAAIGGCLGPAVTSSRIQTGADIDRIWIQMRIYRAADLNRK